MLPPELQPWPSRHYISSSVSDPSFSTSFNGGYSPEGNPKPSPNASSSFYARGSGSGSGSGSLRGGRSSSSRSLKNSRFSQSSFAYNGRIAIALVPCSAFLLDLGGTPVVATLTLGLMIAYILDSLNFKPGSFFALWFSLIAAQIAFFFSSSLLVIFNSLALALLAAFLCAIANFLVGVWVSLQFKWVQIEYPAIVMALERLLFACVPLIASSIFTWATVSAIGMHNAAYYLMVFNCVFYWLFSIPRVSSFKTKQDVSYHGGEVPDENLILGQLESCIHTLNLLFFPLLFHIASHYPIVFSSYASLCDVFLLFFCSLLFQLYASTRGALWWLTKNDRQLKSIRLVNGAVALTVVVLCLECRVVFHSFGRYIQVPPPFNVLLVTITMLGGAAAAGAFALGLVSDAFGSLVFTTLSVIVSAAGAIIVGFPFVVCIPIVLYLIRNCFPKRNRTYCMLSKTSELVLLFILINIWVIEFHISCSLWHLSLHMSS